MYPSLPPRIFGFFSNQGSLIEVKERFLGGEVKSITTIHKSVYDNFAGIVSGYRWVSWSGDGLYIHNLSGIFATRYIIDDMKKVVPSPSATTFIVVKQNGDFTLFDTQGRYQKGEEYTRSKLPKGTKVYKYPEKFSETGVDEFGFITDDIFYVKSSSPDGSATVAFNSEFDDPEAGLFYRADCFWVPSGVRGYFVGAEWGSDKLCLYQVNEVGEVVYVGTLLKLNTQYDSLRGSRKKLVKFLTGKVSFWEKEGLKSLELRARVWLWGEKQKLGEVPGTFKFTDVYLSYNKFACVFTSNPYRPGPSSGVENFEDEIREWDLEELKGNRYVKLLEPEVPKDVGKIVAGFLSGYTKRRHEPRSKFLLLSDDKFLINNVFPNGKEYGDNLYTAYACCNVPGVLDVLQSQGVAKDVAGVVAGFL